MDADEPVLLALPREVAEQLGYYVYLYFDPENPAQPFYVGKGQAKRVLAHLDEQGESRKHQVLAALRARGVAPRIELLAHGLPTEEMALRIESAAIDLLGLTQLTNRVRGAKSLQYGRISLSDAIAQYGATPIEVQHPVISFRINRLFRPHMTAEELYEATRGVWAANGPRRARAKIAFAVFLGVVREVYEIEDWEPADPACYRTRTDVPSHDDDGSQLWQFRGQQARPEIRDLYLMKSVAAYHRKGDRSGFRYLPR